MGAEMDGNVHLAAEILNEINGPISVKEQTELVLVVLFLVSRLRGQKIIPTFARQDSVGVGRQYGCIPCPPTSRLWW
jgi:hypothetical protein